MYKTCCKYNEQKSPCGLHSNKHVCLVCLWSRHVFMIRKHLKKNILTRAPTFSKVRLFWKCNVRIIWSISLKGKNIWSSILIVSKYILGTLYPNWILWNWVGVGSQPMKTSDFYLFVSWPWKSHIRWALWNSFWRVALNSPPSPP